MTDVRYLDATGLDPLHSGRWFLAVQAMADIAARAGLSPWERPLRVSGRQWLMWQCGSFVPVEREAVEVEVRRFLGRHFQVAGEGASLRVSHIGVNKRMVAGVMSAMAQVLGARAEKGASNAHRD